MTGIEGKQVMFVDVNSPAYIEKMIEMQEEIFKRFVDKNGYISKESYLGTLEAARFLGIEFDPENEKDISKVRVAMHKFTNPKYSDPPLPVCKNLAGDKYRVDDLIEFANSRRVIKRLRRR